MSAVDLSSLNIIERTTLTDDIVEKLIEFIADNNLREGDMLPSESQLTDALGVSRLPLREALSRLKAFRVIDVRQGKGAIIRSVDVSNLFRQLSPVMRSQGNLNPRHMIEVRRSLEPSVARLAAIRRGDELLENMGGCVVCMENSLANKAEFIRCDMEFHNLMALATGNPALDVLVSTIHDIMSAIQWSYPDDIRARETSLQHHKRIFDAIAGRDAEGATSAIEAHLNDIERSIV